MARPLSGFRVSRTRYPCFLFWAIFGRFLWWRGFGVGRGHWLGRAIGRRGAVGWWGFVLLFCVWWGGYGKGLIYYIFNQYVKTLLRLVGRVLIYTKLY